MVRKGSVLIEIFTLCAVVSRWARLRETRSPGKDSVSSPLSLISGRPPLLLCFVQTEIVWAPLACPALMEDYCFSERPTLTSIHLCSRSLSLRVSSIRSWGVWGVCRATELFCSPWGKLWKPSCRVLFTMPVFFCAIYSPSSSTVLPLPICAAMTAMQSSSSLRPQSTRLNFNPRCPAAERAICGGGNDQGWRRHLLSGLLHTEHRRSEATSFRWSNKALVVVQKMHLKQVSFCLHPYSDKRENNFQ